MIAFTQVFEDIATVVLLPARIVAVGATNIATLALIILHSTQSKSLRVGIKNCFVLVFMTTIISAIASMMQICAAEGNEPTAENDVAQMPETGKTLERQEPKNEVSKHPKNDVAPEAYSKKSACFDDHELLITVVNEKGTPIVGATVRTSSDGVELEVLETNDAGQVTTKKRGTESVSIQTEATGYRPTTMGVDGAPANVKIFMLPQTELTVVDEAGKALEGIFVGRECFASMNLDFDRNGFPIEPNLNFGRDPKEFRTSHDGHFRLVNEITLRTLDNPVPLWAIDDNGYQFGWVWVPPADLDQPQTLALKKTAFVEASFLINPQTREQVYAWSLLDSSGFRIAGVAPNVSSMGSKEFCNLRFRLPPGDFFLRREIPNGNPDTSVLGFRIDADQTHVDLGLVEELSDAIDLDSEWGSVYGRIRVTNADRLDLRRRLLVNGGANRLFPVDIFSDDLLVDPQSGGLEGAFVYLAKAPALIHPEAAKVPVTLLICDQGAGRFEPHLMIVRVGQSVECVNTSTIAMNVHNFPLRNQAVNMMIRPLTKPGAGMLWASKREESLPMRIASDFHPWMTAYCLVLDHPYSAITDQQGRFAIENLPPGQHIVKIWHERVGYIERKLNVAIEPGQITAQPTIKIEASTLMPQ